MKIALITGAAHPIGIGFASARALRALGYDVIVTGISDEEIAQTPKVEGIRSIVLDVTDPAAVEELFGGLDRLDALVNCAGRVSWERFALEEFEKTVDVDVTP